MKDCMKKYKVIIECCDDYSESIVQEFFVDIFPTEFRFDGGRITFDGYSETVWVHSHEFSIKVQEV